MNLMRSPKDHTEELLNLSPTVLFFRLSVPGIIGMLVFGLYQFVDGIFVGQFVGPEGMGAVGLAYPLSLLNNAVSGLIGAGASSVLSRSIGRRDMETRQRLFPAVFLLNLIISGSLSIISYVYAPWLVDFMGGEGLMLELGVIYMRTIVIGTFFINFAASSNMLIRAGGLMKEAMIFLGSGAVLNLILDPILIKTLDLGIAGAGAATVISQVVSLILSIIHFNSKKTVIKFSLNIRKIDPKHISEILKIGFSSMALPVMAIVEIVVAYRLLNIYAEINDVIALGTIFKIFSLLLPPVWGIAQGMQPFIGVNEGAGKRERLLHGFTVFTVYATVFTTALWAFLAFFPRTVTGWFITDTAVLDLIYHAPRIFFFLYPVYGFLFNTLILLQATGRAKQAAIFVTLRMLLFFVPPMLIICPYFGAIGVWLANPIADLLSSIAVLIALRYFIKSIRRDQVYV